MAGTTDKLVKIYDYHTYKQKLSLHGHNSTLESVLFINDRSKACSSAGDRTIKFWDIEKSVCCKQISCGSTCKTMDYFTSEPYILTGHCDGSVRLYSLFETKKDAVYKIEDIFDGAVTSVKISNDGNLAIASGKDG